MLSLAKIKSAHIIILGRDKNKCESTVSDVINATGNSFIEYRLVDLSSQASIRGFVSKFREEDTPINLLINNAGVMCGKRILTADGYELTIAVNYLAPFLLTNLLIDQLKKNAQSRILNVVSDFHSDEISFNNFNSEKKFSPFNAYKLSKLALIIFTFHLSKKLSNSGITVNCFHPGFLKTNISRGLSGLYKIGFKAASFIFAKPAVKAAADLVYLATSPELNNVTGKYFKGRVEARAASIAYDEQVAEKLWNLSLKLTGLALNDTQ
ncbi:MAG: SDR family NAD(P)-dependent oxidoreductase [Candidatus Odinarchaeum yellowstonii]|uniref:SDR family NAD(P)-dependent oxidoreductase n=1 Tax=Odinarchaeota yellowstonii (strain LCB_4) TaxID=1841599 RepID=A0AAF0IC25_ODILC|nr:MAG: SDR family NAD(P)-dependent oxidoreductase [Candidatus Odinarchaeum yellowstonii]